VKQQDKHIDHYFDAARKEQVSPSLDEVKAIVGAGALVGAGVAATSKASAAGTAKTVAGLTIKKGIIIALGAGAVGTTAVVIATSEEDPEVEQSIPAAVPEIATDENVIADTAIAFSDAVAEMDTTPLAVVEVPQEELPDVTPPDPVEIVTPDPEDVESPEILEPKEETIELVQYHVPYPADFDSISKMKQGQDITKGMTVEELKFIEDKMKAFGVNLKFKNVDMIDGGLSSARIDVRINNTTDEGSTRLHCMFDIADFENVKLLFRRNSSMQTLCFTYTVDEGPVNSCGCKN